MSTIKMVLGLVLFSIGAVLVLAQSDISSLLKTGDESFAARKYDAA